MLWVQTLFLQDKQQQQQQQRIIYLEFDSDIWNKPAASFQEGK